MPAIPISDLSRRDVSIRASENQTHRVRRPTGLAASDTATATSLVVCDDPMHREQTGSGRPGAKGSLHTG